jgi:8-oxo-dGTP diphosphatase
MSFIDKLAWIEIKNRKVLMTRSKGKDVYYIAGGKRELGETDEQALIREIKEELTVDLMPKTIKFFGKFEAQAHGKPAGTNVLMTCYSADYEGIVSPSSEIEEVIWLTYKDREKTSYVDKIIFDFLKKSDLID